MGEEMHPLSSPDTTIPGWDEFVDKLRELPKVVLAKLPERVRDDPQTRQELARKMQSAMVFSLFDALAGDGDYPFFRPGNGFVFNFGQPNADTIYRLAKITPGGSYRIRGRRGNLRAAICARRSSRSAGRSPASPAARPARHSPGLRSIIMTSTRSSSTGKAGST